MAAQTLEGKARETINKAAAAVKDGADAAAAGASSVLDDAMERGREAAAFVEDTARRAGAQAGEIGEQVYARGERAARSVARQTKEEPLAALLIAGAVGVAIGYLLARR